MPDSLYFEFSFSSTLEAAGNCLFDARVAGTRRVIVDIIGFALDGSQMQLVVRLRCLFVFFDAGGLWAFVPNFVALQIQRHTAQS